MKKIFVILATISLSLGVIGIFVPGLPTTPFLLLSAGLYSKSSDKLYFWLINHPKFGTKIKKYQETKSLTLKTKISSILLMWIMISLSSLYFINNLNLKIFLIAIGIIGSIVMGFVIKTRK